MYLSFISLYPMGGSREGRGSGPPLKNHKNIGFLSNTDPDPLENHKATKHHLHGFRWRADDGPLIVVFESSLHSSTKNKQQQKRCQSWTPSDKTSWISAFTLYIIPLNF